MGNQEVIAHRLKRIWEDGTIGYPDYHYKVVDDIELKQMYDLEVKRLETLGYKVNDEVKVRVESINVSLIGRNK